MTGGGIVLVTGATGFLGPYVAASLRAAGWRVRAALRERRQTSADESVVVGPIGRDTAWTDALKGVVAVVHLAGLAHQLHRTDAKQDAQFFEVNREGTLHLAQAAAGRVGRFVFMSTVLVNGPTTDGREPFRETDTPRPRTAYARSKAEAEDGLLRIAAANGLPTTIIRPPLIYGRGAKGNFRLLAKAVRARLPLPLGAAHNRRAFVAAENVASFITHSSVNSERASGVFIVADDREVSTAEFIRLMARALDRRIFLPPVPTSAITAVLRLGGKAHLAESLFGSLQVDRTKAAVTGWRPAVSLEEGLARALKPRNEM